MSAAVKMLENPARRRPKTASERVMLQWAAYPPIQRLLSSALKKPVFPRDIYVSENAKYVHYTVANKAVFEQRSFRTISLGQRGTKGVVGSPKGQWDDVRQRSRVGTRLVSILVPVERLERAVRAFSSRKARYAKNPTIMTVMNPAYGKNPIDLEYDKSKKMYHVYRTNPSRRVRMSRNPIPLWMNNPYVEKGAMAEAASYGQNPFGPIETKAVPMEQNPWDLPAVPAVYNQNPARNPMDLATVTPYAIYDQNPKPESESAPNPESNPLVSREYHKLMDRSNELDTESRTETDPERRGFLAGKAAAGQQIASSYYPYRRQQLRRMMSMAPNPSHGPYCENPCCNDNSPREGSFEENPAAKFKVGDWVRNLKRIELGTELKLEKEQIGVVTGVGMFMGDTLYSVEFETPRGMKTFKFFGGEIRIAREGWTSNPHEPASMSGYRRSAPNASDVNDLARQPSGRPSFKPMKTRKARIPIQQFEAWLRRSGSREDWARYQKEKVAYRRFHKGADPTFITRRVVDVGAGKKMIGRAFGYSMGKSPFEPYITPKGSGKGANKPYLHEYETMPEGITNSSGKVVIKPLEGRTKITDWIHY
jgi:hypothetical protein